MCLFYVSLHLLFKLLGAISVCGSEAELIFGRRTASLVFFCEAFVVTMNTKLEVVGVLLSPELVCVFVVLLRFQLSENHVWGGGSFSA